MTERSNELLTAKVLRSDVLAASMKQDKISIRD